MCIFYAPLSFSFSHDCELVMEKNMERDFSNYFQSEERDLCIMCAPQRRNAMINIQYLYSGFKCSKGFMFIIM